MTFQNINSLDDAALWFETQETRTLRFFACRAALRVLPIWIETATSPRFRIGSQHILPVLRSNIIGLSLFCSETSVPKSASFQASQNTYKSAALADDKDDAAALAASFSGYTHLSFSVEGPNSSSRWMVARACGEIESIATLKSKSKVARSNAALPWMLFNYDTQSAFSFRFFSEPLWESIPEWAMTALDFMRSAWVPSAPGGDFWMRWYQGFLDGNPLRWDLQRDIALIPDEDWQKGEAHIARLIAELERRYNADHPAPDPVSRELVSLSPAKPKAVERILIAITANRDALPPTFDAIEGFIALEIERLQKLNYTSDDHAEECRRQIAVLCSLDSAMKRLRVAIPADGEVTVSDAEKVEKLSRVYARHFAEWPRANASDFVDSTYRGALVGATTAFAALCGLPLPFALGAGIALFGGKKIGEAIKVAKDALK